MRWPWLLDEDPSHTAHGSKDLAAELGIRLIWLPKRCPELNGMDHLWGHGKDHILANRQYLYCNSFSRSLGRFRGGIASGVGVASFQSLGRRDDRARTSRDLAAPLDTRQRTEAETATGKLGWLEHTGPLEDAESLPLLRQNQADELLQYNDRRRG